uniref:Uncharacterized protein n=1 Tax=uncultured Bacteroidota bacterium TaxID=152509 RepID=H5SAZ6_9BACT|nr:hypothetical protein HGMM_F06F04C13 [uncultured Bacteroidetes bacterium]
MAVADCKEAVPLSKSGSMSPERVFVRGKALCEDTINERSADRWFADEEFTVKRCEHNAWNKSDQFLRGRGTTGGCTDTLPPGLIVLNRNCQCSTEIMPHVCYDSVAASVKLNKLVITNRQK